MCEEKRGCPHCPRVPVNSLQSAKGSEEITPHGREVIFAMSKGTSRHPSQDYKNFGTRFRGSCTKFHRILQQCAPLFFGLYFFLYFHSSTIHFSILRVSALKFTPILKSFRPSEAKRKRVMLVMNLLQSLLGRAVQLEFYHIDKLVSLQDKVNASFARMIFHLGIEADKLEYDEKHILVM